MSSGTTSTLQHTEKVFDSVEDADSPHDQRHPPAGMAGDAAGEIELEQHMVDHRRRQAGEADDLVHLDRRRPERVDDPLAVGVVGPDGLTGPSATGAP